MVHIQLEELQSTDIVEKGVGSSQAKNAYQPLLALAVEVTTSAAWASGGAGVGLGGEKGGLGSLGGGSGAYLVVMYHGYVHGRLLCP